MKECFLIIVSHEIWLEIGQIPGTKIFAFEMFEIPRKRVTRNSSVIPYEDLSKAYITQKVFNFVVIYLFWKSMKMLKNGRHSNARL